MDQRRRSSESDTAASSDAIASYASTSSVSDRLLAALIDSSIDAIISKDVHGRVTSWNRSAEQLFGYTAQEMLGQPILRIIPPELQFQEARILTTIGRGESVPAFDTERLRKDGTRVAVSLSMSPIRDTDGNIVGAAKIARDITQRREAERARATLAAVVDTAGDAIFTYTLDGTLRSWNRGAEQLFGYPAHDVIGRNVALVLPEERQNEIAREIIPAIMRNERVVDRETVRMRRDGTTFDALLSAAPLTGPEGSPVAVAVILRDISERKQLERQLRRSDARHRALIGATAAVPWVCPPSGVQDEGQPAWMALTGQTAEEMLGSGWTAAVHPDDVATAAARWADAVTRVVPLESEFRVRGKDGQWRWMSVHAAPIMNAAGRVDEWFGLCIDITERRSNHESLQERNRQLDLLARCSQLLVVGTQSTEELLTTVFGEVARAIGAEMYFHYQPHDAASMRLCNWSGLTDDERTFFATMRYGELLCGRVAARRQRLIVEDIAHTDIEGSEAVRAAGYGAYAGFPLLAGAQLLGTIAFITRRKTHFADGEVQVLQSVCDQMAAVLDRRQARARLAEREAQLAVFVEHAPAAIAMFDGDMRYLAASRRYLVEYGLPQIDVVGRSHYELFPEVSQRWRNIHARVLAGETLSAAEDPLPRADGGNDWVRWTMTPWRDAEAAKGGALLLSEVITKEVESRRTIAASEERLRFVTDRAGVGYWHWDIGPDHLEFSASCKRMFGIPLDDPIDYGRFLDAVHPADRDRTDAAVRACLAGDGALDYDIEYRIRWSDGTVRWIHAKGNALFEAGRASRMAGIALDVTERKQAEEALREADRHKDEFLAMLGHELRNPLAPIRNASEILLRKLPDDPALHGPLELIERQSAQLARLVDDLLDVSRIASGRIELKPELLEVGTILEQAAETIGPLVAEKRHRLHVYRPQEKLYVSGDRARLVQALGNLLHNAAKYTRAAGEITLDVRASVNRVDIEVRDEGAGISPELLPRIFDLFVQSERTLDRAEGGLGIGLSVVKRLVEMQGGTVTAHSDGLGRGSAFSICLPRASAPEQPPPSHAPGKATSPLRILVVDDNVDAADSLAMLLTLEGHDVATVYDGLAALDAVEAREFDVVLLDIGMPQVDGYEVARRLRRRSDAKRLRLVAMTGYGQEADRTRADIAGFDAHLVKPADIDAITDALRPVDAPIR